MLTPNSPPRHAPRPKLQALALAACVALAAPLALTGCGSAILAISAGDSDDPEAPRTATNPAPATDATNVDVLLATADPIGSLRWSPAPGLVGQTLRLAETEASLEDEPLIEAPVLGSSFVVWTVGLEPDTEYVWRVDTRFAEGADEVLGDVWNFRTSPSRTESEPNNGPLQATSLSNDRTLLADLLPDPIEEAPDFDWYRVGLQAGRLYSLDLDALALDTAAWSTAQALPEVQLLDPNGNEVLWRHAFPLERIDSAEPLLFPEPLDLGFGRLSVLETGLYFLRVRAISADDTTATTVDGARYALRLTDLESTVLYEVETRTQSQETGFSNDSVIVAEPFSLTVDPFDNNRFQANLSGYLISGLEEQTPVPPTGPLPLVSGFDWFRFALPDAGPLFEIQVELSATRMGEHRPDSGGGLGDLELNYFRSTGFATTAATAFDLDSFRGGDPKLSLIGRADNGLLKSQFLGVAHNPIHYQAESFGSFNLADNYSLAGVPFTLSVTATRLVPGDNLVEELPTDNDTAAEAQPMDYDQSFRGNLANGADTVDWIEFEGQAGDVISIELFDPNRTFALNGSTATPDLELTLFRLTGGTDIVQPAENTVALPLAAPLLNQRRFLQTILRDSGTYGLELLSNGPAIAPAGFDYVLRLDRLQQSPFESEPNNTQATADIDLLTSSTVAGQLLQLIGNDTDVYNVQASEGEILRIRLLCAGDPSRSLDLERAGFGGTAAPLLEVLDEEGTVLMTAARNATPEIEYPSASRLNDPLPSLHALFEAPAAGTYSLRITDQDGPTATSARYALQVVRE